MDAVRAVYQLLTKPIFSGLVKKIDLLISASLSHYCENVAPLSGRQTAKAVKDAVWGMIDLTEQEIIVLDSPILQRLRYVKQLGVTYLTYPTASYSRFEHTLGAMHQAERMLRAIAARSKAKDELLSEKVTVRLAAMLHDIGHLPLSHVAERYYSERECTDLVLLREVEEIKNEIALTLPARVHRFSECLSIGLALTPSFTQLLRKAGYTQVQIAEAILSIVGRPPSLERAFLAQIITNVIDADKLDYMFRDAFYTGVPLGVDLERLLYKLRCLTVPHDQCPEDMRQMFSGRGDARVLGTDLPGQRHAYDLSASRTMLFERVYHHHKTLAAERMVLRMLDNLKLHPAELLVEDDRFFSGYAKDKHPDENHEYLESLDTRHLPRRSFAMSYGFLKPVLARRGDEIPEVPDAAKEAWDALEYDINDAHKRLALEREICNVASQIAVELGVDLGPFEVWIDTAPGSFELPEVDLLIERPDETVTKQASFPADAAAFAKNPFALSYVYVTGAGQRGREIVFLAIEILFARRFQLALGRLAADHAKIKWEAIQEDKRIIEAKYPTYFNAIRAIRPVSAVARTSSATARISKLAERFGHYDVGDGIRINADRLRSYLDQFPEKLVPAMLKVLEGIKFLDREQLGRKFSETICEGASAGDVCVPLSDKLDKSAAHLAYFLADKPEVRLITLQDAIDGPGSITFVDDCLLSGSQARTVLQTWFGMSKDLDEPLTEELEPIDRGLLKEKSVRFRFLFATDAGINSLKELSMVCDLGDDVSARTIVSKAPRQLDEVLVNEKDVVSELRAFLADVGSQLLKSTKGVTSPEKWTEDRCKGFALGYGGFEQLLVMSYNTPTATITALWKGGQVGEVPWLPLFPRRNEESPLVSVSD
jgi:HD superfamily phosphohydrolase